MAFGSKLQLEVSDKKGGKPLAILLAPLTKEAMPEFIADGGMQSFNVTRYLGPAATTAPVFEDELDWFEKARKDKNSVIWGIYVRQGDTWKPIGNTSLNSLEHSALGIQAVSGVLIFNPDFWGKGIVSHIHKARTWFAFTQLGIMRIMSAVIHGNDASRLALEKSGYQFVYTERNTTFLDGVWRHQDNLECLNPLDAFWTRWWGDDEPGEASLKSRKVSLEAIDWAKEHVKIL